MSRSRWGHPLGANKFHAIPALVDGIRFASTKEATRFMELRLLEHAGRCAEIVLQPVFPLSIMRLADAPGPIRVIHCGTYRADFQYLDLQTGEIVVEDVKSSATRTEAYRLRKRIVEAVHGITITEY